MDSLWSHTLGKMDSFFNTNNQNKIPVIILDFRLLFLQTENRRQLFVAQGNQAIEKYGIFVI